MEEEICPVCKSSALMEGTFAGTEMQVCLNCAAFWEKETRSPDKMHQPCDNCAFRPGSPERSNPEKWEDLLGALYTNHFWCHKRVPCEIDGNVYRFLVETDGKGKATNARVCMGYVAMCLGRLGQIKALQPAGKEGERV